MTVSVFGEPGSTRTWAAAFCSDLASLATLAPPPGPTFVLLLNLDARPYTDAALQEAAATLLGLGARYACCWGPDCDRTHDAFDAASERLRLNTSSVVMTTAHDAEPLVEALWYATHAAIPADGYEAAYDAVLCLSVANMAWHQEACSYLEAGAPLPEDGA